MRQRLHQFGCGGDARRERQAACGGGLQQLRRRARADAELGAERLRACQIVRVEDGADADDGVRHVRNHRLGGLDRNRRAQRDFQGAHTAGDEGFGERDRVFQPLDGENGDHRRLPEQIGEFFLFRCRAHAEPL